MEPELYGVLELGSSGLKNGISLKCVLRPAPACAVFTSGIVEHWE